MNINLNKSDHVQITLKNLETYKGQIEYFNEIAIELSNVITNGKQLDMNLTFYFNEIESIIDQNSVLTNGQKVEPDPQKSILIPKEEFERMKDLTINCVYLKKFDDIYREAQYNLSKAENIAIFGAGNYYNKENRISILGIASFFNIYIFDLQSLNKLRYIKNILEMDCITKIVHDGQNLSDSLKRDYNIEICNVFDTKVADIVLSRKLEEEGVPKNITECLVHRLNLPPVMLESALDDLDDKKWTDRPLTEFQKRLISTLVISLHYLKHHIDELLLSDYYDLFKKVYKKERDISFRLQNVNINDS